ncbi:hypothetical protein [Actinomadura flavalba]|uniref:hypothetical protein n=1 Tax=Actinomadura flavalba TaxID=1120938 RepID=UPI000369D5B5|nr:hypothetical protein [Actinomadura flavalba]
MTPGTLVLLHAPLASSAVWGDLPEALRAHGFDVVAPTVPDGTGPHYVARASLIVAATAPEPPLVLVGHGDAGPLLPALARAQRAAHRAVGAYVFVDAALPGPASDHDHPDAVAVPPDWPDAPCGYLRTHASRLADPATSQAARLERTLRESRLRGWPTREPTPPTTPAESLTDLLKAL